MRNIFKSLLVVTLLIGVFSYAFAYDHKGVAAGTIELGTISTTPGAGNKFGKYKDGAYLYRSSAWSFSSGKGIKTQNSNSGVVFYLANSADITITILFDASKNFANVDAKLYTISDSDYDKLFTGTENKTAVTFSSTEYETKTVVIDKKGSFQETFPALPAGYYYIVCTGTGSNTYFTQFIVGESSTPVTPTVSSVTVSPSSATLEINGTQQLTATVDASPASADKTVTWSTSDANVAKVSSTGLVTAIAQGTATITATSNLDNTKSGTCTITVNAPAAPIPVTAIGLDATATIGIGESKTLSVTYTPTDANQGKAVSWNSANNNIATVDANGVVTGVAAGTVAITATSTTDPAITASCNVTVQAVAVTGVSLNKSSLDLQIGGNETLTATIAPSNASDKSVTWTSSNPDVASVNSGTVNAISAGTTTITVTSTDGNKTATCTVKVTDGPPVPYTTLSIHQPEVYEGPELGGGYNTPLVAFGGREYEVYYTERTSDNDYPTFSTTLANEGKANGISGSTSKTKNEGRPEDKWFEGTIISHSECKNASDQDEFDFETKMIREHRLGASDTYQFHVKGFDQFSLWGMDKKLDPKNGNQVFVVKVDGVVQQTDASLYNTEKYTIRRYNITTGEHLIEISTTATGTNYCYMGGFSLRVAQEPRTKRVKGEMEQSVKQTQNIKNVTFFTKYNSMGMTQIVWEGEEATGIGLQKGNSNELGDTLILGGQANCPTGEYNFRVVSLYNGRETSSVSGKLTVTSEIIAAGRTQVTGYQNEDIDPIQFRYYALSENDITLTWKNGNEPEGISGSGKDGKYTISGIPTTTGEFIYIISVKGGNSIEDTIRVKVLDLGNDPVMYLYKNDGTPERDGVYKYLTDHGRNLIERKTKEEGLRPADQLEKYKWILISEDVDATNPEVQAILRGEANLPVLNMQAYAYNPGRMEWGEASSASVSDNGKSITVQRADHPIFQAMGKKQGDKIQVLDSIARRGLMTISVHYDSTLCLATALTRDKTDYYQDGLTEETFIHEIPAALRGGKKYICLPIAMTSTSELTAEGKQLLDETVKYLLGSKPTVSFAKLEITSFSLGTHKGAIDQDNNTITITVDESEGIDLKQAQPVVTLASTQSHVTPNSGETVDLSDNYFGLDYVVSDYIHRRVYNVVVKVNRKEGLDEIRDAYSVGDWVNIYDIQGRKLTTTNEDIYQMALPAGVYIISTAKGTFKITR